MEERRAPTTEKVQSMIEGGGGANVKSGTVAANTGANSVTFNTPFA
ncbi:unnamed protein product, partial [marine sediment metagenome]